VKAIQPWNPFRELESMQKNFADFFKDNADWSKLPQLSTFTPAMDISEDKEAFHFKVEYQDGVLTISGKKNFEKESKNDDKKYHLVERSYGSFMRSFNVPSTADTDKVHAEYTNGVLDLKIAKKVLPEPKSKTISVK
jgi:HSP20 family protein